MEIPSQCFLSQKRQCWPTQVGQFALYFAFSPRVKKEIPVAPCVGRVSVSRCPRTLVPSKKRSTGFKLTPARACLLLTNQRNATSPAFKAVAREEANKMMGIENPIKFSKRAMQRKTADQPIVPNLEHVHPVQCPKWYYLMLSCSWRSFGLQSFWIPWSCGWLVTGPRKKQLLPGCLLLKMGATLLQETTLSIY